MGNNIEIRVKSSEVQELLKGDNNIERLIREIGDLEAINRELL